MPIFDTHCHYNLDPFYSDWESYWQKAKSEGVTDSTIVGVDIATSKLAVQLAEREAHFFPIIGCHPGSYQEVIEKNENTETQLLQLIEFEKKEVSSLINKSVVAIGETGLDYFRLPDDIQTITLIKKIQQAAFRAHLQIAQDHDLPVVIHARDKGNQAYEDIIRILQEEKYVQPFILHCVSGPSEYVQAAIRMGAYIGLAGNLTYRNSEHLRELAAFAPANRLLLETDAPFLPPVPYRGKPCEPWMISQTASYFKEELSLDIEQMYQNSFEVFNLK